MGPYGAHHGSRNMKNPPIRTMSTSDDITGSKCVAKDDSANLTGHEQLLAWAHMELTMLL